MHLLRLALSLLPLGASARAEVEFVGVLANGGETKVVFRDEAAGFNSGWVGIGATVRGYTVVEYRAAPDVLVLRQGERLHEIPLAQSKIQRRKPDIVGQLKIGDPTAAGISCDLLFGVPKVVPFPDGRRLTIEVRKEPDGTIAYHAVLEKTEGTANVGGNPIPIVSKRQVNGTARAGQSTVLPVAEDVTVSLKF